MHERPDEGRPRLGELRAADGADGCDYADERDTSACEQQATVHLWVADAEDEADMLACEEHAPVARMAGLVVAEHPVSDLCGQVDAPWDPDRNCCIPGTQ